MFSILFIIVSMINDFLDFCFSQKAIRFVVQKIRLSFHAVNNSFKFKERVAEWLRSSLRNHEAWCSTPAQDKIGDVCYS